MVRTPDRTRLNRLVAPRILAALLLSGPGSVQVAPLSLRRITSSLMGMFASPVWNHSGRTEHRNETKRQYTRFSCGVRASAGPPVLQGAGGGAVACLWGEATLVGWIAYRPGALPRRMTRMQWRRPHDDLRIRSQPGRARAARYRRPRRPAQRVRRHVFALPIAPGERRESKWLLQSYELLTRTVRTCGNADATLPHLIPRT